MTLWGPGRVGSPMPAAIAAARTHTAQALTRQLGTEDGIAAAANRLELLLLAGPG